MVFASAMLGASALELHAVRFCGQCFGYVRSNDCGWLSFDVLLPSYECLYNYISFIAQGSVRFVYLQQMICPNVISYLTQYKATANTGY